MIALLLALACNPADTDPVVETGDTDTDAPWPGPCRAPDGTLDGLIELGWDDGDPALDIDGTGWGYTGYQGSYTIAEEVLHEAVRFELTEPTCVHGFRVHWSEPEGELTASLYPDFGLNGFDMWHYEPLWTGTAQAADADGDGWVTYVLDEPLLVEQPGLVYVGHRRDHDGLPSFSMDATTTGEGDCGHFDDCHSAVNNPEVETGSMFPGWSFSIPYDFLVRLAVEPVGTLAEDDRVFRATDLVVSNRAAWGDYDADGWDDLYSTGTLWRNQGDGTFADVTEAAGLSGIPSSGGVWGDYDDDGCLDLFVFAESYSAGDSLLRSSCDGTFADVTAAAGIDDLQSANDCGDPANVHAPSAAAAWWDMDGDGDLDLYVPNFICWSDYSFYRDDAYRNEGDGTFTRVSGEGGLSTAARSGRGASPVDHDQDGDVDLLVNNYTLHANLFYDNLGDGTFQEAAQARGLAGDAFHAGGVTFYYGHTIGAAWGDLDGDADFDCVQANLAHPRFFDFSDKTQVLLQGDDHTFTDLTGAWETPLGAPSGLRYSETHSVPVLADFDQDGALDLVITAVYDGRPTDFYWGNGDGSFTLDVYGAGLTTENGWGAAAADVDHDGDPDLVAATLFENTLEQTGHWLQVRAVGDVDSNHAGIGATVRAHVGERVVLRHVSGGTGQGCQDSLYVHLGLGEAEAVDAVEVDFPGGGTVRYDGPFAADQRLWLYESGRVEPGWAPTESHGFRIAGPRTPRALSAARFAHFRQSRTEVRFLPPS